MPKKREEREIERWITVHGARVPIFKGQSVEEAVKESVGKRSAGKKQSDKQKASESIKVHKDMTEEEKKKKMREISEAVGAVTSGEMRESSDPGYDPKEAKRAQIDALKKQAAKKADVSKKEVGATISDEEWKSAKEDVMDMMDDNTARQNLSGEDKKRWTAAEKYLDKYGVAVGDLADEGNGRGSWEKIQAAQRDIKELYEKGARNHYARQQAAKKADAGAKADREKAAVSKENYHLNADQRRAKETTQNAEAKDRYGKDWNGLTDEQKKSIDDQLKKNHPLWYGGKMNSVEKRANEVWDKAQKTAEADREKASKTVFGSQMEERIDTYQNKFLKKRSDAELEQLKSNLEKNAKISGRATENDQVALAAIERERKARADKTSRTVSKNEDIKEKQLAANKSQATRATGRGWAAEHIENDLIRPGGNNADDIRKYIDYNYRIGYITDSEKVTLLKKLDSREKAGQTTGKRGSTPEFKDYNEAKEYYQKRFAEMSPQNMNRIARNMQIGGRGKEKIAALAEAKAKEWQKGSAVQEERDKQARHTAERVAQEQAYASMNQRRRELKEQRRAEAAAKADAGAKKDRMQAASNNLERKLADSLKKYNRPNADKEAYNLIEAYKKGQLEPERLTMWGLSKDELKSLSAQGKTEAEHDVASGRTKKKVIGMDGKVHTVDKKTAYEKNYGVDISRSAGKSGISKESAGAMSNVYDGGKKASSTSTGSAKPKYSKDETVHVRIPAKIAGVPKGTVVRATIHSVKEDGSYLVSSAKYGLMHYSADEVYKKRKDVK